MPYTTMKNSYVDKTEDKSLSENVNPAKWGSHAWAMFHYIAVSYPLSPSYSMKMHAINFIKSLPFLLPCETCRMHSRVFIDSVNLEMATANKNEFFKFFVDFHNYVNARKNKSVLSYSHAYELYKN